MSQPQAQTKPATSVAEKKQRSTAFRVEEQKRIQINKTHSDRRERAQVLKIISIGLFGRKRYRNIYLVSSLNNFYHALMIANTLQKRVEKLALVINFEKIKYTEYADQNAKGQDKDYSVFTIKITRKPTQDDKKNIGYNQGLDKIENPLTEIIKTKINRANGGRFNRNDRQGPRRNQQQQRRGNNNNNNNNNNNDRRNNQQSERRPDQRRDQRQRREQRRPDRRNDNQRQDRRHDDRNNINNRRPQRQDRRNDRRDDDRDRRFRPQGDRRDNYRREDRGDRQYNRPRYDQKPRYNNDRDFERDRPRYRQDKHEKVQEQEYRRGERKTRGGDRVVQHNYNKEHLNREEDRKDRKPTRNQNRYSSDDQK